MLSSPPKRPWEGPSSPADSQYSLDLGPLDDDSHSGQSTPPPQAKIERILSEDIEGPSDFTLNLEKWMKGGTARGSKAMLSHLKEQAAKAEQGLHDVPLPTEGVADDQVTESHHTPDNTPPKSASQWSIPKRDDDDPLLRQPRHKEPDSSDWDPYNQESTPQPPPHTHLLQPTVEEYYSEMVPNHHQSARPLAEGEDTNTRLARHPSSSHSEPSTVGRVSSPAISLVRSPVLSRTISARTVTEERLDFSLQQLQKRCHQLEGLNSALSQTLGEERRVQNQENTLYQARLADAIERERMLVAARKAEEDAFRKADQWMTRSADQEGVVNALGDRVAQHEEQIQRLLVNHVIEVRELRQQLDARNQAYAAQAREAGNLQNAMDAARRTHTDAKQSSGGEETNKYHDSNDAELDRMQLELDQDYDLNAELDDLRSQLRDANEEKQRLQTETTAARENTAVLEAELTRLTTTKENEASRAAIEHHRITELAEALQRRTKDLQQQLRDQRAISEAEAELKRVQVPEVNADLSELRDEITAKQAALDSALLERDALQDDVDALRTEFSTVKSEHDSVTIELAEIKSALQTATSTIVDAEANNAAFDAKISSAVRRREAYWHQRLATSEEERKIMVKQLLHQWGREELSKAVPQCFEYQVVGDMARSGKSA